MKPGNGEELVTLASPTPMVGTIPTRVARRLTSSGGGLRGRRGGLLGAGEGRGHHQRGGNGKRERAHEDHRYLHDRR